jgi:hypothetical protein
MSFTDKYLQPHGLFQNLSFEKFCSEIPEFYFRKDVPEDVVQNFEIVEKLLAFSYYEYKFIDEAYAKAIHSFEMAMSIRYKELSLPLPKGKLVFDFLIKSLSEQNCFDTDITILAQVKQMRNHFSHPERHSFAGAAYWNRIEFISRLVNELYEDVALRIERRKIANEFIDSKRELNLDKFVVMRIGADEPIILFNVTLLWINNKQSPRTYLIEYTPLFDLHYETEYQIKGPEIFGLKIINPIFTTKGLTAIDTATGKGVYFSSITNNPEQMNLFQKWQTEYDSISWNFMYEHSIQMWSSEILVPELQKFQKM